MSGGDVVKFKGRTMTRSRAIRLGYTDAAVNPDQDILDLGGVVDPEKPDALQVLDDLAAEAKAKFPDGYGVDLADYDVTNPDALLNDFVVAPAEDELVQAMRGAKSVISAVGTVTNPQTDEEKQAVVDAAVEAGILEEPVSIDGIVSNRVTEDTYVEVIDSQSGPVEVPAEPRVDPVTGIPFQFGTVPPGPPPFQIKPQFAKAVDKDLPTSLPRKRRVGSR